MAIIEAGWQQLQYSQSAFLVGAGISVTPTPLTVHGRVLPGPEMIFGQNNKVSLQVSDALPTVRLSSNFRAQRPGVWDVMGKVLFEPARLGDWIVVDFALADPKALQPFVDDLTRAMRERGQYCMQY